MIVGLVSAKSARKANTLENVSGVNITILSLNTVEEDFLFGGLIFFSSSDWMKLTHVIQGNLLYSKSADLNVNYI